MEPDIRDHVIDFVGTWSEKTEIAISKFIGWLKISSSKFYHWKKRYGKANEHNRKIPRDFYLESWEKEAIISYYHKHPNDGYRRLCYMMLDDDVVAVSPSSVYRVLKNAGLLRKWNKKKSSKGTGFIGPKKPHEHWHIDISYLNICGTFYYLCSLIDGYSRYVVHWEIRSKMQESDVEIIVQRALEKFPGVTPRLISDHGSQFIARDFKDFIRISKLTHVFTSVGYPQSNGKVERFFRTVKSECIRPRTPLSLEDAQRIVSEFVAYYNMVRLHSAIGYITPEDKINHLETIIFNDRDTKLEQARQRRKLNRIKNQEHAESDNSNQKFTKNLINC